MMFEYYKSMGTEKPETIDSHSSNSVVYLRKNIKEIKRHDEMSNEDVVEYEYDECKIPKDAFNKSAGEILLELMNVHNTNS